MAEVDTPPFASVQESHRFSRDADCSAAVPACFDSRQAPLGWTLAAMSSSSDYPSFALLEGESLDQVRLLREQLSMQ